jgi:hypothetical protein
MFQIYLGWSENSGRHQLAGTGESVRGNFSPKPLMTGSQDTISTADHLSRQTVGGFSHRKT